MAFIGALSIFSCRNVDYDNTENREENFGEIPINGKVNVQVNLLGTYFSSQKGAYGTPKTQTFVQEISPGKKIVAELKPTVSTFSDIVKGENLPEGHPFRVVVFDQEDKTLVDYKDFKVGEEKLSSFTLDFEGKYIFVAYTDASGKLPEFNINKIDDTNKNDKYEETGKDNNDENDVDKGNKKDKEGEESPSLQTEKTIDDILIDFSGADLMYFKLENYSPSELGNVLNVTLMHKASNLSLDVKQILYKEYVKDVSITSNYMSGVAKISTGTIVERKEPIKYEIEGLMFKGSEGEVISNLVPINSSDSITFRAKIKQYNEFNEIELPFKLESGTKYTLSLKLTYNCGAYVSKGLWKEFMCHNLGANYKAHPMDNATELCGNKYQWGQKEPFTTHEEEVKNIAKTVPTIDVPITAWQDDFKTENDPCPIGYRVPNLDNFKGLTQYNSVQLISTWSGDKPYLMKLGEDLILPFAGYNNGKTALIGEHGFYWTSHADSKTENSRFVIHNNGTYNIDKHKSNFALSIRCVKEPQRLIETGWDTEKNIEIKIDKIINEGIIINTNKKGTKESPKL